MTFPIFPTTFGYCPNVLGQSDFLRYAEPYTHNQEVISGSFSTVSSYKNLNIPISSNEWDNLCTCGTAELKFSASQSSVIYGTSTRVQPKSAQLLLIIKT